MKAIKAAAGGTIRGPRGGLYKMVNGKRVAVKKRTYKRSWLPPSGAKKADAPKPATQKAASPSPPTKPTATHAPASKKVDIREALAAAFAPHKLSAVKKALAREAEHAAKAHRMGLPLGGVAR